MKSFTRHWLYTLITLAILIAGVPVHSAMPCHGEAAGVPDHATLEYQRTTEDQGHCPSTLAEASDSTAPESACEQPDNCGDECRMSCAGLMLVLVLDNAPPVLAAWSPTLDSPSQLHLSAGLSGLLRPPQA